MPFGRHLVKGPPALLGAVAPVIGAAWLIGRIFRDAHPAGMGLYFIPAPVAVAACLAGALRRRSSAWLRLLNSALAALALGVMFVHDFAWHRPQNGSALRIVHWNTARRYRKAPAVFRVAASDRPDLCLFSESPRVPNLAALGRDVLHLPYLLDQQGMTLFSRWPITPVTVIPVTAGRGWVARVDTPSGPLNILAFDVVSHPNLDRAPPMRDLAAWIRQHTSRRPLLVLGDFNTPRDSVSFAPLRDLVSNAYETAGHGWPYSWPVPFPVYAIDHAFYSPEVRILDHTYRTSLLSDHRRQVLEISITAHK